MNNIPKHEITPGDLLTNFNGRSLKSIILFTIVVHVVLLLVTSGSYIWRSVSGADGSKLSEDERVALAVKEASASMRRIAEQHGIKPQDLSSRFAAGAPTAATKPKADPKAAPPSDSKATVDSPVAPTNAQPAAPEKPKSAIEKEINKAVPGPTVPGAGDEDLFK